MCLIFSIVTKLIFSFLKYLFKFFIQFSFHLIFTTPLLNMAAAAAVTLVVSDSVRPHRQQPTRLPCPWDSLGKNAGVGCHFLLQCMKVKSESEVTQCARLLATPWTTAYEAPPSMGFSRQEYWSGLPLPSPNGTLLSHKKEQNKAICRNMSATRDYHTE